MDTLFIVLEEKSQELIKLCMGVEKHIKKNEKVKPAYLSGWNEFTETVKYDYSEYNSIIRKNNIDFTKLDSCLVGFRQMQDIFQKLAVIGPPLMMIFTNRW